MEDSRINNPYICRNCKKTNVFKRKPYKPVSENIVGYCKYCNHVIWKDRSKQEENNRS